MEQKKTVEDIWFDEKKTQFISDVEPFFPNGGRDYESICELFEALVDGKIKNAVFKMP